MSKFPVVQAAPAARLLALDWMRGLVMVLMAVDHAGAMLDAGHVADDSAATYEPGSPLPLPHLLTRVVTHLCAPTFVFLAGTVIALSVSRSLQSGRSAADVDRHLVLRGGLLVLTDLLFISGLNSVLERFPLLILQVLYAIGLSMALMPLLRRLPGRVLAACALAFFAGSELLTFAVWDPAAPTPVWVGLTLAPATWPGRPYAMSLYPVLPWLAILVLGYAFGLALLRARAEDRTRGLERRLVAWGLAGIAVFLVLRGANGYGNMGLLREDGSLAHWLHVSKYPPSLTFFALTLGVMALLLAPALALERRLAGRVPRGEPLSVFGSVPFFYYLAHFLVLGALTLSGLLGGKGEGGLRETYLAAGLTALVLYPACRAYAAYKRRHPRGWTRYL